MAYPDINTVDMTSGIQNPFIYLNTVTNGLFMPLIIGMLYVVIVMSMYYSQKRMTGRSKPAVCFAVGGFVMAVFVMILGMIPGMINGVTVVEVIIMACVGVLWLYFSKNNDYGG